MSSNDMEIDNESTTNNDTTTSSSTTTTQSSSSSRIVFPGDQLTVTGTGIRLGNGLVQSSLIQSFTSSSTPSQPSSSSDPSSSTVGHVTATKCGLLTKGIQGSLSLDNRQKRYIACVDDM